MAKLLEGKVIAARIKKELESQIQNLKKKPLLCSIMVGDNSSAQVYINSQKKLALDLGIDYRLHQLDKDISEEKMLDCIQKLNLDKSVDGIIIQMPLPKQIDYKKISSFILPEKDVEGINPFNLGNIFFGKAKVLPCTAQAVMELIKETGIDLYGKEVVIIGHSEIVGKPLSLLLLDKFATTTVCHIGTWHANKLEEHIKRAEILIVAVGKVNLVKGSWIKEGAVVIDVGINKVEDKIVGDVEFEEAVKHASWITPVPGGVGPLTTVILMRNLINLIK